MGLYGKIGSEFDIIDDCDVTLHLIAFLCKGGGKVGYAVFLFRTLLFV